MTTPDDDSTLFWKRRGNSRRKKTHYIFQFDLIIPQIAITITDCAIRLGVLHTYIRFSVLSTLLLAIIYSRGYFTITREAHLGLDYTQLFKVSDIQCMLVIFCKKRNKYKNSLAWDRIAWSSAGWHCDRLGGGVCSLPAAIFLFVTENILSHSCVVLNKNVRCHLFRSVCVGV